MASEAKTTQLAATDTRLKANSQDLKMEMSALAPKVGIIKNDDVMKFKSCNEITKSNTD